jgi:uncharacterized repeat protein (TIGR03803 family)
MKTQIQIPFLLPALMAALGLMLADRATAQTFTTLHNFTGGSDGGNLNAGLILSGKTLYGAADSGGSGGNGTVFSLNTNGTPFTTLYSFTAGSGSDPNLTNSDGDQPFAALVISGNMLYGTAFYGGTNGKGTIFAVNTNGTGSFTNLHTFSTGNNIPPFGYFTNRAVNRDSVIPYTNSDGGSPQAGLVLSGNTLYGAASYGGVSALGTVFAINTDGTGFTNLYSFKAGGYNSSNTYTNSDGADPHGVLLLSGNMLYGTTLFGGANGNGTVFKVNTDGTGFTNLYSFTAGSGIFPNVTNSSGANPADGLILSGNTLYGTTYDGGTNGYGSVFALNTNGTGFTNLYSFTGRNDGANLVGSLILSGNTLYGTAYNGGINGNGTVFSLNTNGTGFTTLYNFTSESSGINNDGANPYAGLTLSGNTLYGTAKSGGNYGDGTVFSIYLGIGPLPIVAIQPTNSSVLLTVGSDVTFSVSVTGTGPFSYQWQLNSNNLPNGIITTVAGGGSNYPGNGVAATNAELSNPSAVAVDTTGNLFIADTDYYRIREVDTNGIITTVAGGGYGYSGDGGAATNAEMSTPYAVAVDTTGNLFIADTLNHLIREVDTNGIITTVAGNAVFGPFSGGGYSGDGSAATNAELNHPYGVAVDATGNLFIADTGNGRIRKVGTNGIITTVAGNGINSYSGDGGVATNAELGFPQRVAVDATGNLFIADTGNGRIRKVGTNGIITTVAGGEFNYPGNGGAATNAELGAPRAVAVDTIGNLFIADEGNYVIRNVGTNGIINTVAGNGTNGHFGDGGAATNAELNDPYDVAVDTTGNLFIADEGNQRIREVVFNSSVLTPTLVLNDVGFGNAGKYDVVVSGPYGSVTSSVVNVIIPPFLSVPTIPVGKTNFTFQLSGPAGSNYVLQVSTNLLNWSSVSTSSIPVSGTITFTNPVSGYSNSFYRAYLQ